MTLLRGGCLNRGPAFSVDIPGHPFTRTHTTLIHCVDLSLLRSGGCLIPLN